MQTRWYNENEAGNYNWSLSFDIGIVVRKAYSDGVDLIFTL